LRGLVRGPLLVGGLGPGPPRAPLNPALPKMHILSINFITFTAQIYNSLHMQGKIGRLASWVGGMVALPPSLNPPMTDGEYLRNGSSNRQLETNLIDCDLSRVRSDKLGALWSINKNVWLSNSDPS